MRKEAHPGQKNIVHSSLTTLARRGEMVTRYTLGSSPLVVTSFPRATRNICGVIEKARKDLREQDIYQYMDRDNKNGVSQLFTIVSIYADLFRDTNTGNRPKLEKLWRSCYDHPGCKECVDELLDAEEHYEDFVDEIEKALRVGEKAQTVRSSALAGHVLPKDLSLVMAATGKPSTLGTCWKDSKYTLFVLIRHFG